MILYLWGIYVFVSTNFNIKNTGTYFANKNNLFFDAEKVSMVPNNYSDLKNINIGQLQGENGYFYLSNRYMCILQ